MPTNNAVDATNVPLSIDTSFKSRYNESLYNKRRWGNRLGLGLCDVSNGFWLGVAVLDFDHALY